MGGQGASRNLIEGNFIGTDAEGRHRLWATFGKEWISDYGTQFEFSSVNTIGGTTASAANNLIDGNQNGVMIYDDYDTISRWPGMSSKELVGTNRWSAGLGKRHTR